ncbi:MAG TPA: hypothetical protein VI299_26260 [Polyangiales bacterium]
MRAYAMALMTMTGCVRGVPPPPPSPSCPEPPPAPAAVGSAVPTLYDLRWELSVAQEPARPLQDELATFTAGRWECALGKTQVDDAREASQLRLRRSRKLACTHASGSTVQTALACEVMTGSPMPAAQILPLQLDTAPALAVRCTAVPVERLMSALGAMCAAPEGVTYCSTR